MTKYEGASKIVVKETVTGGLAGSGMGSNPLAPEVQKTEGYRYGLSADQATPGEWYCRGYLTSAAPGMDIFSGNVWVGGAHNSHDNHEQFPKDSETPMNGRLFANSKALYLACCDLLNKGREEDVRAVAAIVRKIDEAKGES